MELLNGRYKIRKVLGKGGFGTTFLAENKQQSNGSLCVVKQLQPSFSEPYLLKKAKDLFNREAETLGILGKHPNIPTLFAYFEENNEFYIIQEYIAGHTLEDELLPHRPLSEPQVIKILREVLNILKFVHRHNVIHRDIKPANLIRRKRDNKLVLIDFGSVKKVTNAQKNKGTIVGSYAYIPEEQYNGHPNFSSDIYALGMIGIQAITGLELKQMLGAGFSLNEEGEIDWQKYALVSDNLANFLSMMVRNNYQQRYQSAKEALHALQEITEKKPSVNVNNIAKVEKLTITSPKKLIVGGAIVGLMVILLTIYSLVIKPKLYLQLPLTGKSTEGILQNPKKCEYLAANFSCDKYAFSGKKGQKVIIEMFSQSFDPYLIILKSDKSLLAVNDNISKYHWNSQIVVDLPQDGRYIVIAGSSEAGASGKYSLRAIIK